MCSPCKVSPNFTLWNVEKCIFHFIDLIPVFPLQLFSIRYARNLKLIFPNSDTHLELRLGQVCTLLANIFQKTRLSSYQQMLQ